MKKRSPGSTNSTRSATPAETTRAQRKAAFLAAFKRLRWQGDACEAAGLDRTTVHLWRGEDKDFAKAYDAIEAAMTEMYEKKLAQHAFGAGRESVAALKMALQARAPQKYSDRLKHEVTNTQTESTIAELIVLFKQKIGTDRCPHCKTLLGLRDSIVKDLMALSGRLTADSPAA